MRKAPEIVLTSEERETLTVWARGRSVPVRLAERATIVLAAADGGENKDIARRLGFGENKVGRWRGRFAERRVAGIESDLPRAGRRPDAETFRRVLDATTRTKPEAATHWSTRTLAERLGTSASTVRRAWKSAGLTPHRTRTFKVSRDPQFSEKLADVVGARSRAGQ
jgi:transposase